jgi:hypothetical protein
MILNSQEKINANHHIYYYTWIIWSN